MNVFSLAAAIAAALVCAPALAQTITSNDDARPLGRVVVVGTIPKPMPANTADLRDDALASARAATSDTAQLLTRIPGVSIQGAGGVSGLPAIHGLVGDRNRVQVDGMDILASCPNHMNPPLSYIAPSSVAEIKVYAGISPVSAGGDSIGGTIQVQSQPPRFADGNGWEIGGSLGVQYRRNGDARSTDAALTLANADWSFGYEGSVSRAGNYRAGGNFRSFSATGVEGREIDRDEVASSAYLLRNHRAMAAFRHDTHLLQASFARQETPHQLFPNQRMDMLGNTQNRWQLAYQGNLGWGALEARVWHERLRHGMDFGPDKQFWYGMEAMLSGVNTHTRACSPISTSCAAGMPMETESRTRAASLALSINLSEDDLLRLGSEWQQYQLNDWWPPSGSAMWPDTFWNIHQGRRSRASLYSEWEGTFSPQWSVLIGARYSRVLTNAGDVQGYDTDPNPPGSYLMTAADAATFNAQDRRQRDEHFDVSALLRWTPSTSLDLEAGIARKTRSPNLYERYTWSTWAMAAVMNNFAGDGNGYVGNIGLQPETAHTASMTLDWHAPGNQPVWRLRITPWVTRISDYIDVYALTNNGSDAFNVLRYANQSARLHGVDLSAETRLGRLDLDAVVNWQRGDNHTTNQPLYNQMPPNARISLKHRLGGWEGGIDMQGVAAKTRVSAVRNEAPTTGYGLLHLRGAYQWQQWRADFGVENVFNRLYNLPTGGVYLAQGRTMGINAVPWGIPVPGPGRSYYMALRLAL
ncbi:MAG: TonB-dependent receptor [Pseudomonadota bacterium]|nr:TonB-dependent receptor [Pseudomonadota bacterium]